MGNGLGCVLVVMEGFLSGREEWMGRGRASMVGEEITLLTANPEPCV